MGGFDGGIPETPLDQTDIGPVQVSVVCEILLGDSLLRTLLSDNLGERG